MIETHNICFCLTGKYNEAPDFYGVDYEAFEVDLDHITVWMCKKCLVGLEEW